MFFDNSLRMLPSIILVKLDYCNSVTVGSTNSMPNLQCIDASYSSDVVKHHISIVCEASHTSNAYQNSVHFLPKLEHTRTLK